MAAERAAAAEEDAKWASAADAVRVEAETRLARLRSEKSRALAREELEAAMVAEALVAVKAAEMAEKRELHDLATARQWIRDGYSLERVIELTGWPEVMLKDANYRLDTW